MTSGGNKCPLVGVIGLFNKTVTGLYCEARARQDRSDQEESSETLQPQESVLYCVDLWGHPLQKCAKYEV